MASFQITDLQASLEVIVFSRSYESVQGRLKDGEIVIVEGKLDSADGRPRLLADGIYSVDEARDRPKSNGNGGASRIGRSDAVSPAEATPSPDLAVGPPRRLTIEIHRGPSREEDLDRIEAVYALLQRFRGRDDAEIIVLHGRRRYSVTLPNNTVGFCQELAAELTSMLGELAWRVDERRISA
jgi:hypothetical protein